MNKRRSNISLPVIVTAGLVTIGCVATRPVHYYTLMPLSVPTNKSRPDGPTILVGMLAAPEILQDSRIRYRSGANVTGSYEYHRWATGPAMMVRDALVRALRASGNYRFVMESSSSATGDYLLRGQLHEFTELDDPAIQTQIFLHLELIDEKTNHEVWDRRFMREEPAGGKNIEDVVASMDRNLQQIVTDASAEIGQFLAQPNRDAKDLH
jgi:ABC-type uncharacterized transport system auxiliary subunit